MFRLRNIHEIVGVCASLCLLSAAAAQPLYVHGSAAGANNGQTWTDAFTDLQSALAVGAGREIWIAEGVYYPGPIGSPISTTFMVPSGAILIGGFAGHETSIAQRTLGEHPTVLSGDLARNDPASGTDNASHVITVVNVALGPVIDALMITGGRATPLLGPPIGGGLLVNNAQVLVRDCVFINNTTVTGGGGGGGAVGVMSATADFIRTRFEGNSSGDVGTNFQTIQPGGAVYGMGGIMSFTRCDFIGNRTGKGCMSWCDHGTPRPAYFGSPGGAMALDACTTRIEGSRFISNSSGPGGDGTVCYVGGSPRAGPGAAGGSGAAIAVNGGSIDIVSCVFSGNTTGAPGYSPAGTTPALPGTDTVATIGATSRVVACTFVANRSPAGTNLDGAYVNDPSSIVWTPGDPGTPVDPHFVSASGGDGIVGTADDDLRLMLDSPYIDAGQNSLIPSGFTVDAGGHARFVDVPGVPDTGTGTPPIVDRGAYEARPPACAADFDASGTLTIADLASYLNAWFGGSLSADFNGGGLSIQDVFDFLNAWFAGC